MKKVVLLCVLFLFIAGSAYATAIQWEGNNHWYEIVRYTPDELTQVSGLGYLPWELAEILAEPRGGYLATITTAEENAFVWGLASGDEDPAGLWLGGFQTDNNAEPAGNWAWVTGETWDYTNWATSPYTEPNNDVNGTQDYLHFWPGDGVWDDMENGRYMAGFIAESEHNPNPVPEPATMLLLGIGLLTIGGLGRKRIKK